MKKLLLIAFVCITTISFSQSESDITFIRNLVEQTNLHLNDYNSSILKNDELTSAAGNETLVFTEELNKIRLIKETFFGETGKTIIWNYFNDKQPIFIFKEYFKYKLPISNKNFNKNDFTKNEERFYLKNNRIIRWMKDKKIVKKYPTNAADIENNMLQHINSLVTKFEQENIE